MPNIINILPTHVTSKIVNFMNQDRWIHPFFFIYINKLEMIKLISFDQSWQSALFQKVLMVVNQDIHTCKTFDSYVFLYILLWPSQNSPLHYPFCHPNGENFHLSFSTSKINKCDFKTNLGYCHALLKQHCIMDQISWLHLIFLGSIEIFLVS